MYDTNAATSTSAAQTPVGAFKATRPKTVLAASLKRALESASVVETPKGVRPLDEGRMLFENSKFSAEVDLRIRSVLCALCASAVSR